MALRSMRGAFFFWSYFCRILRIGKIFRKFYCRMLANAILRALLTADYFQLCNLRSYIKIVENTAYLVVACGVDYCLIKKLI